MNGVPLAAWADALLAWAHLLAILSWTVFLGSSTALARAEWLNAAALARLVLVLRIATIGGGATLLTGGLRLAFGPKGSAWTLGQPLLWGKLALVLGMLWVGAQALREAGGWHRALAAGGALPPPDAVAALRQRVMRAAHLMLWLPLAGVLLARGLAVV